MDSIIGDVQYRKILNSKDSMTIGVDVSTYNVLGNLFCQFINNIRIIPICEFFNINKKIFANASIYQILNKLIQSKDSNFTDENGDYGGCVSKISNIDVFNNQVNSYGKITNAADKIFKPSLEIASNLDAFEQNYFYVQDYEIGDKKCLK